MLRDLKCLFTPIIAMASADIPDTALPSHLPKLVVFDLDYTLWPFWADTLYDSHYKSDGTGGVVGRRGADRKKLYPDSRDILEILNKANVPIAAASRTDDPPMARNLLVLFDIDRYFSFKEIYPGSKVNHFKRFHKDSRVAYKDKIFFDDEERNIEEIALLGVTCVHVERGINKKTFFQGLKTFSRKK